MEIVDTPDFSKISGGNGHPWTDQSLAETTLNFKAAIKILAGSKFSGDDGHPCVVPSRFNDCI